MTLDQSFFLTCLADFCHNRNSILSVEKVNLDNVFRLAKEHSLCGVIYKQCGCLLGNHNIFSDAYLADVFFSINREYIFHEVAEKFTKNNIPYICMKGSVFRDCWPIPELRTMGDIDLIIRTEDRRMTDQIMTEKLNFSKIVDNHAVWTYYSDYFEFEIHDHMFYEYLSNRYNYRLYFDQIWNHIHQDRVFGYSAENQYVPDENFHLLYLITHSAKHIINKGIGFRAFLDMVFFTQKNAGRLDWKWLEEELDKLHLLEFTKICFSLCERWFQVEMPIKSKLIKESFYMSVTDKICNDGIFGLKNPQNDAANSAKEIERSPYPYVIASLLLTAKKVFPPYRDMQLIPWYAWVDGRPWLMPIAWIYRWIYCIRHKKNESISLLSEPFNKRRIIDNRKHSLQEWGLGL